MPRDHGEWSPTPGEIGVSPRDPHVRADCPRHSLRAHAHARSHVRRFGLLRRHAVTRRTRQEAATNGGAAHGRQDPDLFRLRDRIRIHGARQDFYARRDAEPRSCPSCRASRKAARGATAVVNSRGGSYSSGGGYDSGYGRGGGYSAGGDSDGYGRGDGYGARRSAPREMSIRACSNSATGRHAPRSARPMASRSTARTASAPCGATDTGHPCTTPGRGLRGPAFEFPRVTRGLRLASRLRASPAARRAPRGVNVRAGVHAHRIATWLLLGGPWAARSPTRSSAGACRQTAPGSPSTAAGRATRGSGSSQ